MDTDYKRQWDDKAYPHAELTREIIGAAFAVHNELSCGLLERPYENALCVELRRRALQAEDQKPYEVTYRGENVGTYWADIVVEQKVLVEVKSVEAVNDSHRSQVLNYLRISGLRVGLLMNFAKTRLKYERLVV